MEQLLNNVDIIIHCAAFVSAPESFLKFNECYDINVHALLLILIELKLGSLFFVVLNNALGSTINQKNQILNEKFLFIELIPMG